MKKSTIGLIINTEKLGVEEKIFLKIAKKSNVDIVFFNIAEELDEKEIEKMAKKCDIIYNDTGEFVAMELVKTLEELGKKVVDSSKIYYYTEDKWMFFMKCREHKIPTLETVLLPDDLAGARKELKDFNKWPVVLKRVYGERGEFVEKARNINEAMRKIKAFWKKGNERLPVIAQEFVRSDSYRVTVINGKIMQTALKKHHNWKATGCYSMRFRKFKVDASLKKIVKKVWKMAKIDVCGIDFVKKDGKWLVLEVNAEPSFNFFDSEMDLLIKEVLNMLKKKI